MRGNTIVKSCGACCRWSAGSLQPAHRCHITSRVAHSFLQAFKSEVPQSGGDRADPRLALAVAGCGRAGREGANYLGSFSAGVRQVS